MSNKSTTKQHWLAEVTIQRQKSKLRNRRNKAIARWVRENKLQTRYWIYESAVNALWWNKVI